MTSPGSRTLPVGLTYKGFLAEAEGPHWLRWIDGVDLGSRATGSSLVHVHFFRARGGPGSTGSPDLESLARAEGSRAVAVHAAALSFLRLETVFLAGVATGSLPMVRRSFTFEADSTAVASLRTFDPCPLPRPHWWKSPWSVLPRQAHSLDGKTIAVPGPHDGDDGAHSRRIRDLPGLLRAGAPPRRDAAVGAVGVARRPGGQCDLDRRAGSPLGDRPPVGLTAASALPAAAFALTDFGRGVAAGIHRALIGRSGHWKWLSPGIPYEWTTVELDVSGLAFPPEHAQALGLDRFMALRIETIRWPAPLAGLPARIVYRLDNYTTVRHVRDPKTDEPVRHVPTHRVPVPDEVTGTVPLTPDFAPSDTADPVVVAFQTTPMEGGPIIERMPLTETVEVERTGGKPFDAGRLPFASAGRSGGGSSPAAPLRPTVDDGAASVPAFGDLVDALNALRREGSISRWAPVVPIDDKSAVRGGMRPGCSQAGGRAVATHGPTCPMDAVARRWSWPSPYHGASST